MQATAADQSKQKLPTSIKASLLGAALFSACLTVFSSTDLLAATYYVDKAGNNGNSCATAATASSNRTLAKLTIDAGKNCATVAGDTVIVGDGTYVEGNINITSSGTLNNRITIRAEHKWLAILSSISSCQPNIGIAAEGVVIDGLSLVINAANVYCAPNSASGTGVRCWPFGGATAIGCIVRNIKTDDPTGPSGKIRSHGIKTNQSNSIIEDNELDAGLETHSPDNTTGYGTIVRRNHITGGGSWGNGIVTKGAGHNILVYDNVIDAPTDMPGAGLYLGGSSASSVPPQECFNCAAWNNVVRVPASQIALVFQGCRDCLFTNNVVLSGSIGIFTAPTSGSINNKWLNNIINCNGGAATQNLQGTYTIDYNNFFNCSGTPSQAHPITGDPQFVNPQSDWHLRPGSPAIGSGTLVSFTGFTGGLIDVSKDADGLIRLVPWSLGRYRSVGTTDTTPPIAPAGLVVN